MSIERLREEIARSLYESAVVIPGRKKTDWEDAHQPARTYRLAQADALLELAVVQELLADRIRLGRVRELMGRMANSWRMRPAALLLRQALGDE